MRGFDDVFMAPHSRYTENRASDIHACDRLRVLAQGKESGVYICTADNGRQVFVMNMTGSLWTGSITGIWTGDSTFLFP